MKIALMIDSLAVGGAQKHVRQVACGLAADGWSVSVYVLNEIVSPLYLDPLREAKVRVVVVGRARVGSGWGLWEVAEDLAKERSELLLTFLFVSTVFGRVVALAVPGLRVITCLQARNVNYREWQKLLVRATAGLSSWTFSNSRSALRWAEHGEGVDLRRATFLPNAIEGPSSADDAPTWTDLGFPQLETHRVIGAIGRLDSQKGFDVLIAAFSELRREFPDLSLLLIGEGPERKRLEQASRQAGCESAVVLAGERLDTERFFPKLEIYTQPSRFEGTPNALMEAMAMGCPVVATHVDGTAEVMVDGVHGRLVEPEQIAPLREALRALLKDRGAARAMGRAAQQMVAKTYSPAALHAGYRSALRRLRKAEVCS